MKASCLHDAVTRVAWSTSPSGTSSYGSDRAMIDRTAASALVQPAGRRALDARSKTDPDPAVGLPPFQRAAYSWYNVHASWSTMIAWRSDPPSTWMSEPNGYGPGSLSSA